MEQNKVEECLEKLKEEKIIVAYCCCGTKRTSSTSGSGC